MNWKKIGLALLFSLGLVSGPLFAAAANYYVDGGCTKNGDGLTCDLTHKLGTADCDDIANWLCATADDAAGPARTMTRGVSLVVDDDQVLIVAGEHSDIDHTDSTDHTAGAYNGAYTEDLVLPTITAAVSHPAIIKPYGFGATPHVVHLVGTTTGLTIGASTYVTIEGLSFEYASTAGISIEAGAANIVLDSNTYINAPVLVSGSSTPVSITNSTFTGQPGAGITLTAQPADAATAITVTGNYFYDACGGVTLTGTDSGNFTGTTISNNLFSGLTTLGAFTTGAYTDHAVFSNNVITGNYVAGVVVMPTVSADANQFYNNLFVNSVAGAPAFYFATFTPAPTITNNLVYNNTMVDLAGVALQSTQINPSTVTGNIFRNNLFASSTNASLVFWAFPSTTNLFESNYLKSVAIDLNRNLVFWRGINFTCGIPDGGSDQSINAYEGNICPYGAANTIAAVKANLFVSASANDFRLNPYAAALNRGLRTGQCSTTTSTICQLNIDCPGVETCIVIRATALFNTVANASLSTVFPYRLDEGGAATGNGWDVGAFEERVSDGGLELGLSTQRWGGSAEECSVNGSGILDNGSAISGASRHGFGIGAIQGKPVGDTCGSLSQTLAGLDTARTYTIGGFYEATGATAEKKLIVSVDGSMECELTANAATWTTFPTCDFTPAGTTAVLKFEVTSPATNVLFNFDDVSVRVTN